VCLLLCSIFEGGVIPYPKRDFLAEDEPDEKADTGAKRPNCDNVSSRFSQKFLNPSAILLLYWLL